MVLVNGLVYALVALGGFMVGVMSEVKQREMIKVHQGIGPGKKEAGFWEIIKRGYFILVKGSLHSAILIFSFLPFLR